LLILVENNISILINSTSLRLTIYLSEYNSVENGNKVYYTFYEEIALNLSKGSIKYCHYH